MGIQQESRLTRSYLPRAYISVSLMWQWLCSKGYGKRTAQKIKASSLNSGALGLIPNPSCPSLLTCKMASRSIPVLEYLLVFLPLFLQRR